MAVSFTCFYFTPLSLSLSFLHMSHNFYSRNTSFTYFPYTLQGTERFEFFKHVVAFHPIKKTLAAMDWNITKIDSQFILALITFLYVDVVDCTATLFSMARFSGVVDPKSGDFPRSTL